MMSTPGDHPLCDQVGLGTEAERRGRLHSFGLTTLDRQVADRLQADIVRPGLEQLPDGILDRSYFETLAVELDSASYFERRLELGSRLCRDGYPLDVCQGAFATAQSQLMAKGAASDLVALLPRIMGLDMALATESYTRAQVKMLWDQANTDELTGLANRRAIMRTLEQALQAREQVSVLMIDIDHFKRINDEHDHILGDRVLQTVAHRIRHSLRSSDSAGRFGGEEFVVVLRGAGVEAAATIAERIRTRVAAPALEVAGLQLQITISTGVAEARLSEPTMAVIQRADACLYAAKRRGRNRVEVATEHRACGGQRSVA